MPSPAVHADVCGRRPAPVKHQEPKENFAFARRPDLPDFLSSENGRLAGEHGLIGRAHRVRP
jgi:hypothetical protein